jgi:TolA-binding protein
MRERSQSQESAIAAMEAQIAQSEANSRNTRQEMIVRQEKGGLRRYDTRERGKAEINATGRASGGGYGRTSSAEMRQAAAERFAGKAHPIPKTGGFGLH